MTNIKDSYSAARKIYEPFILPSIKEYIEPPSDFSEKRDANINRLSLNSLEISSVSMPKIEKLLIDVCHRLKIDRQLISAFVFPKTDIEAFAYSNKVPITIGISAGAIQRLSSEQLRFVIGHEIGHGLIGSIINYNQNSKTLEDFIFARGMEISADRIGLIAASEIEHATKAILISLSGLDESFLEGHNISKILQGNFETTEDDLYSAHPPLIFRLDALYNLSICREYNDLVGKQNTSTIKLETVNKNIADSLEKKVDKIAMKKIKKNMEDFIIWPLTLLILNQVKVDMSNISDTLNIKVLKEDVLKAFNFVNTYSDFEKPDVLYEKIVTGFKSCQSIAPRQLSQFHELFSKLFPTILYLNKEFIKSSISR